MNEVKFVNPGNSTERWDFEECKVIYRLLWGFGPQKELCTQNDYICGYFRKHLVEKYTKF